MIIVLTHERHGTHIAYSLAEAEECEKNGWMRQEKHPVLGNIEPVAAKAVFEPATTEQDAQPAVAGLSERYQQKFGKKPHWKMKPETIEAALRE